MAYSYDVARRCLVSTCIYHTHTYTHHTKGNKKNTKSDRAKTQPISSKRSTVMINFKSSHKINTCSCAYDTSKIKQNKPKRNENTHTRKTQLTTRVNSQAFLKKLIMLACFPLDLGVAFFAFVAPPPVVADAGLALLLLSPPFSPPPPPMSPPVLAFLSAGGGGVLDLLLCEEG